MNKIERQLGIIQDKAALRAWIDDLPDNAQGLVLLRLPPEDDTQECCVSYREFGGVGMTDIVYLLRAYEHFIFNDLRE